MDDTKKVSTQLNEAVVKELLTHVNARPQTKVMDFQCTPILWMLEKEKSKDAKVGGILAYPMGLGKTVMSILYSLIANYINDVVNQLPKMGPTLIICPKSLISYWKSEIQKHTYVSDYEIAIYYGRHRIYYTVERLKKMKFVISTYDIVRNEYTRGIKHRKTISPLFGINFARILLDEAHRIRSVQAMQTIAVNKLNSRCKWCVTGTPFNNRVTDLISLCQFVNIFPYNELSWWQNHDNVSKQQWRDNFLMIREKPEWMPKVTIHNKFVSMDSDHLEFYNLLQKFASNHYSEFCRSHISQRKKLFNGLLVWLLRLRQASIHPLLMMRAFEKRQTLKAHKNILDESKIKDNNIKSSRILTEILKLQKERDKSHESDDQDVVNDFENFENDNNNDNDNDIDEHDNNNNFVTEKNVLPLNILCEQEQEQKIPEEKECAPFPKDANPFDITRLCSFWKKGYSVTSKFRELINLVEMCLQNDNTKKIVIFSQWTSCLDLIETIFENNINYKFVRLDGSINCADDRHQLVNSFRDDPNIRIFMSTTQAGGLGINLEMAQYVFMFDTWFNPSIEDQAIDRVHRVTQKQEVNVYRIIVENTVENDVLRIQVNKRAKAKEWLSGNIIIQSDDKSNNIAMNSLSKDEVCSIFKKHSGGGFTTVITHDTEYDNNDNNNNNNNYKNKKRNLDLLNDKNFQGDKDKITFIENENSYDQESDHMNNEIDADPAMFIKKLGLTIQKKNLCVNNHHFKRQKKSHKTK